MADRQELMDVLTDAGLTQIATVSAAVTFWSGWAESAASYARGMTEELTRLSLGDNNSDDAVGRMLDLNREYLRTLTELPATTVKRFNEEIEQIARRPRTREQAQPQPAPAKSPQRRAKAKP
jgi:hypothetical protein